jgi:uncharacterized protein YyaL (SSP411 family)
MLNAVGRQFSPNKVLLFVPSETLVLAITKIAEFPRYQTSIDGKATAYVCRNYILDDLIRGQSILIEK